MINRTPPNSATLYGNLSPGEAINIKFTGMPHSLHIFFIASGLKEP